jgi:hypothetical protein
MELRLDRLLSRLRHDPESVLRAIDTDPMLLKREVAGLVLANASKELYTPQLEHQLFAKGIVYRRDPYRLVSLPLVKIYNLGERDVTAADLTALTAEAEVRLHFLRKYDGSLVQVFRTDGRVWFTTRGMIEGAFVRGGGEDGESGDTFDYLGAARRLAEERYPRLLDDPNLLQGRTLLFELIHPGSPKITDYGGHSDLILLTAFDHAAVGYLSHAEVRRLGEAHGLAPVDALSPSGATLVEQIDGLLASLAGTDQEGSVLTFERANEVVYRVKVKSPDYLRLMRLMAFCTYDRTVELLDGLPHVTDWRAFETHLRSQGREAVPEELLGAYRTHFERFAAYRDDCEVLLRRTMALHRELEARLGGRAGREPGEFRKAFAAVAVQSPVRGLLFAALDGRLDLARVRQQCRDHDEVRAILRALNGERGRSDSGSGEARS